MEKFRISHKTKLGRFLKKTEALSGLGGVKPVAVYAAHEYWAATDRNGRNLILMPSPCDDNTPETNLNLPIAQYQPFYYKDRVALKKTWNNVDATEEKIEKLMFKSAEQSTHYATLEIGNWSTNIASFFYELAHSFEGRCIDPEILYYIASLEKEVKRVVQVTIYLNPNDTGVPVCVEFPGCTVYMQPYLFPPTPAFQVEPIPSTETEVPSETTE